MTKEILVIFAHSYLKNSRLQKALLEHISPMDEVTVHNLTQEYPDYKIDIAREQKLMLEHDHIVLQFPFFWYSTPAILKHWLDEVLTYGFAYGEGKQLTDKTFSIAITTGGDEVAYSSEGYNRFNIYSYLQTFDQTAYLCGMTYQQPYLFQGANQKDLDDAKIATKAREYKDYLLAKLRA